MFENVSQWIGTFTAAAGGAVGIAALVFLLLRVARDVRDLISDVKKFIRKWNSRMPEGMLRDFKKLVQQADDLLEGLADIAKRVKMHKVERQLRDVIRKNIYE